MGCVGICYLGTRKANESATISINNNNRNNNSIAVGSGITSAQQSDRIRFCFFFFDFHFWRFSTLSICPYDSDVRPHMGIGHQRCILLLSFEAIMIITDWSRTHMGHQTRRTDRIQFSICMRRILWFAVRSSF